MSGASSEAGESRRRLFSARRRQSGAVHLSQPEGRVYDFNVEAVPAGFKVVRMAYGETFSCKACDRLAITNYPGRLYSGSK
jgi:hypothetical protein